MVYTDYTVEDGMNKVNVRLIPWRIKELFTTRGFEIKVTLFV